MSVKFGLMTIYKGIMCVQMKILNWLNMAPWQKIKIEGQKKGHFLLTLDLVLEPTLQVNIVLKPISKFECARGGKRMESENVFWAMAVLRLSHLLLQEENLKKLNSFFFFSFPKYHFKGVGKSLFVKLVFHVTVRKGQPPGTLDIAYRSLRK